MIRALWQKYADTLGLSTQKMAMNEKEIEVAKKWEKKSRNQLAK